MTATLLTEWSRLLLGTLARAGVEQVVVSPGSRSTPFAWAALNEPKLRCHSVWDERVAAFFALGQARVTGSPSLLICTSGTAAANYYPALIEASLAHLPVLVLTADRPFELQHSSAPQAIDQIKLFGDSARAFFELGAPDPAPSALQGLVRSVAHAVHAAKNGRPGPVHLNARARKPLEPVSADDPVSRALRESVDALLERGPTASTRSALHGDVTRLARACAETARGVIFVGPEPVYRPEAAQALSRLAEITGFPLLCEATSQARFRAEFASGALTIDGFEWLLRSPSLRASLSPDLWLSFGGTPTSGGCERFLGNGFGGQRFVIAEHGFPDPHGLATELISASTASAANDTVRHLQHTRIQQEAERERFRHSWREANRQAWVAVEQELARPAAQLSEACAVREVVEHLPEPCQLVLGNSLPIREIDAYVPSRARPLSILCQRGANGIDGLISGAAGAASVRREATVLLLGDVSFMHDLGGLAVAREAAGPFVIVVIDNGGGRIFEQLPIFGQFAQHSEASRFWLTPPRAELEHAAALFGYRYAKLSERASIPGAVREATSHVGVTVLHIVVEGGSARESEARVRAALEASVGAAR
ncbi:MAG TPA: 2-succinyl-5-enolpyruvyl-6-hydroxy-3-cyclohexene-1-carboxylic-acid synthase [Polyangiaceae bacterium]|nr:2-succinyl-5-enolpyruvyl-6-hydroxy-3-cyclohexene-1-carboxylic-acid synthase [Polyangiaceae bacterium]